MTEVINIVVPGQHAKPRWEQEMRADALESGDAPASLRFLCAIAQAANVAFAEFSTSAGDFILNQHAKAQFGRNAEGYAYLTVGVINKATKERFRLHWQGAAVPYKMKEVAVRHDEGKRVPTVSIALPIEDAEVWRLGQKSRKKHRDPRRNHDTGPDGKPYPRPERRNHNRLCTRDLLA